MLLKFENHRQIIKDIFIVIKLQNVFLIIPLTRSENEKKNPLREIDYPNENRLCR